MELRIRIRVGGYTRAEGGGSEDRDQHGAVVERVEDRMRRESARHAETKTRGASRGPTCQMHNELSGEIEMS